VIVTHDVIDAVLLADRVVVVEGGRVVEEGATQHVLTRPRSRFAARIAGLNMVRGSARGDAVVAADGLHVEGLPQESLIEGQPAVAVFSPSAVAVYRDPPGGSPRNVIRATVSDLEPHAHQVRIHAAGLSADVTPAGLSQLGIVPGDDVVLAVKASEVRVYPA
jgi:molybdate transport system ATP-binding protein